MKSLENKLFAFVMVLFVANVVSDTKTRFTPWVKRVLNPLLKEVYMVKENNDKF